MDRLFLNQNRKDSIVVSQPFMDNKSRVFFNKKPAYLLKVRGDSMQKVGILDGDLIAVKKTDQASHGDIAVTKLGNNGAQNGLRLRNGRYRLASHVVTCEPLLLDSGEITVEGVFVGLVQGNTRH